MSGPQRLLNRDARLIVPILFVISIVLAIGQDIEARYANPLGLKVSRGYIEVDPGIVDSAKGKGLFLHFVNFPKTEQWLALEYYLHYAYALYPAPVLATDPATTVFTIEQLLTANFDPSAGWLVDHGTYFEVTYTWHTDTNSMDWSLAQVNPHETGAAK